VWSRPAAADTGADIIRHHLAGLGVGFAGPIVMRQFQFKAEAPRRGIQHAKPFGRGFLANTIPGDDGDAMLACGHGVSPALSSG